jgi:hypothetical protein
MLQAAKEFQIGRPQIFAGLMLLAFAAQSLWVAGSRKFSDLEYQYLGSGLSQDAGRELRASSPFTGWVAAWPVRALRLAKDVAPASWGPALAIPRPWVMRLPFVVFGVWLGAALWWVSRRLFDDAGGYVALALYCSSPAMVMISSNIGPEIILAWSIFGLIYTAIGVAHTLYAPPRKWMPRIVILGLAIGFALSTALWSFTLVLLALGFMVYLAPGRRRSVLVVLLGAGTIALAVLGYFTWWAGNTAGSALTFLHPQPTLTPVQNLGFVLVESYQLSGLRGVYVGVLPVFFLLSLMVYGSWARSRYFGNTAPLLAGFASVVLFALIPAIHIWDAALGLSFAFVFIGGVAADALETGFRRYCQAILLAGFLLRIVLTISRLNFWIHGAGSNHL